SDKFPAVLAVAMMLAAVGPHLLERAGVLATTFRLAPDGFTLHSIALGQGSYAWYLLVAIYVVGAIGFGAVFGRSVRRTERELRSRLQLQTWQLGQLARVA